MITLPGDIRTFTGYMAYHLHDIAMITQVLCLWLVNVDALSVVLSFGHSHLMNADVLTSHILYTLTGFHPHPTSSSFQNRHAT